MIPSDPYKRVRILGRGAFGLVYLVIKENVYYAMKCIVYKNLPEK